MKRPWRVVLCGSNYAQMYAPVLTPKLGFEAVALLARGSPRSRELAKALHVPLVKDVSDLPAADAACVAVGGSTGTELAREFLTRRIHVIQEHPVVWKEASRTLAIAKRARAAWHVNGHFGDLDAPAEFISACRRELKKSPPRTIVLLADVRLVYGAIDILSRAIGLDATRLRVRERGRKNVTFVGRVGSADAIVVVHASEGYDGADYHFGFDLTIVFDTATHRLPTVAGPVVRAAVIRHDHPHDEMWSVLSAEAPDADGFILNRVQANLGALRSLRTSAERNRIPPEQELTHLRNVMRTRENLVSYLKTPLGR